MGYVPAGIFTHQFMRDTVSDPKFDERALAEIRAELEQVILKVNYHFHSGYESNDARQPESIFMNFFKKQPSIIHSSYLMRIKNRDFRLTLDDRRYVSNIRFTDLAYESYHGMTDTIKKLNKACESLDYVALKEKTNTVDKFFQTTSKIIQSINEFKF